MKIFFVTGNVEKFKVAQKALSDYGIEIIQKKMELPEIQDINIQEVAMYSVKYAAEQLNHPVFVTDAGLYINALNGFPGAFLKFMNFWFKSKDILALMSEESDRTAIAKDCLAYCEPGKDPIFFSSEIECKIAPSPDGSGTTIDQLLIWKGMDKVQGLIPKDIMNEYWTKNNKVYKEFGEYIAGKFVEK